MSNVNAIINDGSLLYKTTSNSSQSLSQLDEISVQIQTNGSALPNGVSVSLLVTFI